MSHLASAEPDGDLDLVAFQEKLLDRLTLEVEVVLVRRRAHADLFEQGNLLVLPRFALFLVLLEPELAVVHEAADRGDGSWGNLDEIYITFLRHSESFEEGDYSELFATFANHTNFAGADSLVDPELFTDGCAPRLL